jgi:hypothetical protein
MYKEKRADTDSRHQTRKAVEGRGIAAGNGTGCCNPRRIGKSDLNTHE